MANQTVWTKNHLAQNYTWTFLFKTKNTKAEFDDAQVVKMKRLRFWNLAASPDARAIAAGALASAMDDYFRNPQKCAADFEEGYEWGNAIQELGGALTTAEGTIFDLAQKVDEIYTFPQGSSDDGGK